MILLSKIRRKMEIKGKVKKVLPLESGEGKNGKGWKRQDFVVEFMDGTFSKLAAFTARTDIAIEKVSKMSDGMDVTVHFNVESREYNEKYYTNLNAWKIEMDLNSVAKVEGDLPF